jgi:MoaA/NifB/PqqE/SkfB family radical SAM enzyme
MKIVVFGTGSVANTLEKVCADAGVEVLAYADNNEQKQGQQYQGKPVVAAAQIDGLHPDKIVIASSFDKEIEDQLLEMGFAEENILIYPGFYHSRGFYVQVKQVHANHVFKTLMIPITHACHLRCAHCSRTDDVWNPDWEMSLETFGNYLSRFDPKQFRTLNLNGSGEPMLVKNINEYLKLAKDMGFEHISFFTSASLIYRDILEEMLANKYVAEMTFSIEGATAATFEMVRGFRFSVFKEFLQVINELRAKYCPELKLIFNATYGKFNLDELVDIVNLAGEYKVEDIYFSPLVAIFSDDKAPEGKISVMENVITDFCAPEVVNTFEAVRQKSKELGIASHISDGKQDLHTCRDPYETVFVNIDGDVWPCCSTAPPGPLVNIKETDFKELWCGPVYADLLKGLRGEDPNFSYCKACWKYNQDVSQLDDVYSMPNK